MREISRIATRSAAALGLIAALVQPGSAWAEDGKAPRPNKVVEQDLPPPPAPAGADLRAPRHPLTGRRPDAKAALFGPDLWRDTPYALLREAVPRLPVRPRSAVVREIAYRLLIAEPLPAGAPDDWALVRAERLAAMAALGEAERIAAGAGAEARTAHSRIVTEIALLHRGHKAACAELAPGAVRSNAYLERALVACQALAGNHDRAAAALGLMREAGRSPDETFAALVTAQQPDLAQPLATLGRADAWTVALFAETKLAWPEDAARLDAPVLLRAVALSRNDPQALRLFAGERAFLAGALSHGELAALYAERPIGAAALAQAARLPLSRYSAPARALLHQAARGTADPGERLEILAHWWRLARADRGDRLAALATVPLMRDIAPAARWRDHAAAAARAWLHAGGLEMAVAWYDVLRAQPFKDMEAYTRLHPLMALAGAEVSAEDLKAWFARQAGQREFGARRIALAQELSAALGAAMPFGAAPEATPPAADVAAALRAAQARRPGEALLLLAVALGERHAEDLHPATLAAAVRILALAGLGNDARRLAIEAALESGF
jgi:hypothetical protein